MTTVLPEVEAVDFDQLEKQFQDSDPDPTLHLIWASSTRTVCGAKDISNHHKTNCPAKGWQIRLPIPETCWGCGMPICTNCINVATHIFKQLGPNA